MTDGSATLSLELQVPQQLPTCDAAPRTPGSLRQGYPHHYVLGPENAVVSRSIGLESPAEDQWLLNIPIVPLTLYAPAGTGKSHLLCALATIWSRQSSPEAVLQITAADFARANARAVNLDDLPRLQQRFQRIELLLVDDLESLTQKPGAQRLLENIVEHRQRHHRPIVLTAGQPLDRLGLSARLTSRLASGLVLPVQRPSMPTRQAILRPMWQQRRLGLTPEAERLLSENESLSVPQLMGLINQLYHDKVARIDTDQIRRLLQATSPKPFDAKDIMRATAKFFGLQQRNLTGSSRRKMDVLARSLAMFLIRELTGASYQQIGKLFGNRDHTTVMHANRKVAANQDSDSTTRHALQEIRRRLGEGTYS